MIILAIGSNLPSTHGDRFKNIDLAIENLQKNKIKLIRRSNYFESLSYPNKTKPKFINVIIQVLTNLDPSELAGLIISIEEKLERKRDLKNDPRTCDIDIIDFNSQVINFKYKNFNFTVPHEKLTERNFVLIPMHEILPNWKHPKTNMPIKLLVDKLSKEDKNSILKVKKS
ncbi:2-amino-4-hydroxy-6-hydroxymethyldihydropteridine diphosphokinase [Pelagibacteraceae bacterium]|jgi:2-amino-4-hydroxy-6-hydroxymethyldihydropteridine diphosphokinase|nr:2-amino-4-hydroxy-6-hydroxymethyldihydropteridine diphosphokinase [Pelagibacteraceae bacterium]